MISQKSKVFVLPENSIGSLKKDLEAIQHAVEQALNRLPVRGLQLTPDGSWWFHADGATTPFIKVIALGTTVPPGGPWQQEAEHWFVHKDAHLINDLAGTPLKIEPHNKTTGTGPSPNLLAEMAALVASQSEYELQIVTKAELALEDWREVDNPAGLPPISGTWTKRYFEEPSAVGSARAKLLFEISSSTPNKLKRVTWLTEARHTGFDRTLDLAPVTWSTNPIPTPQWYFNCEPTLKQPRKKRSPRSATPSAPKKKRRKR